MNRALAMQAIEQSADRAPQAPSGEDALAIYERVQAVKYDWLYQAVSPEAQRRLISENVLPLASRLKAPAFAH